MASIQAVLAPHNAKCSYIDAQSHLPALWWFLAGCQPGQANWSHSQATRAPMDIRQAMNDASVKVDH